MSSSPRRTGLALAAVGGLLCSGLVLTSGSTATAAPEGPLFERLATYPVFQNAPDGVDPLDETVAEISDVSDDGTLVAYTDAAGQRIGFLDITNPAAPVGAGSVDLTVLGDGSDEPTSVSIVGDLVLVVIDSSDGDFTDPSGRVDVLDLDTREVLASIDLGGQPDSIAISPDEAYAAIAMENQRDEDAPADGDPEGEEGELPQAPGGFLQVIELDGAPSTWTADPLALPAEDLADMYAPTDPEPEYVDINDDNLLALSLQENNGIVVVDLETREIVSAFSAGDAVVEHVDTEDDGLFDFSDTIDVPREPDAIAWVGDGLVATANEGDLFGGSRGWSVFDVETGRVVWDAENTFENLAVAHGLHNNGRADNKGAEPEGLAFDVYDGVPHLFVGSERSNFVAVYDMTRPTRPVLRQVMPTTNGPEGLLPVPGRDLFVVSSEEDDAEAGVRATIGLYGLGEDTPTWPDLVSVEEHAGAPAPIGWGALGALAGDRDEAGRMWAASDSAFATGRIYAVDTRRDPAVIDDVITVTDAAGDAPEIDIEGLSTREDGGFWLALEGATGPENALVRTNAAGVIEETVALPEEVTALMDRFGLEGVSSYGSGDEEVLAFVLQRELEGEDVLRIGTYRPGSSGEDAWGWYAYTPEAPVAAGWVGLSEIAWIDADSVAVIERDNQIGTDAALKAVYAVDLPAADGELTPVTKRLAHDLLPDLRRRVDEVMDDG